MVKMLISVYLLCLVIASVLPVASLLDFTACSDDCSPQSDLQCRLSTDDCGKPAESREEGYPSFPEKFEAGVRYDAADDCAPYLTLSWLAPNNYGAMVLTGFRLLFAELHTLIPPLPTCLNWEMMNSWTVEHTKQEIRFQLNCVKLDPGKTYQLIFDNEPIKPQGTQCDMCRTNVTTEYKKKVNGDCRPPPPAPTSSGHITSTTRFAGTNSSKDRYASGTHHSPLTTDTPIASASRSETITLLIVVAILLTTLVLLTVAMRSHIFSCLKGESEPGHPTSMQKGSGISETGHPTSLQDGICPQEILSIGTADMNSIIPPASESGSLYKYPWRRGPVSGMSYIVPPALESVSLYKASGFLGPGKSQQNGILPAEVISVNGISHIVPPASESGSLYKVPSRLGSDYFFDSRLTGLPV